MQNYDTTLLGITLHSFREITYLTALRGRGRVSRCRRCGPSCSGTAVIRTVGTRATPLHHLIGSLLLLIVQLQQLLLLLLQLLLLEAGLHFRIIRFEFRHVAARKCGPTSRGYVRRLACECTVSREFLYRRLHGNRLIDSPLTYMRGG